MKPELKAMISAAENMNLSSTEDDLKAAFLAAVHWRGDELWCGPVHFGSVYGGSPWCAMSFKGEINGRAFDSEEQARDALEAAAREQITKWFEEQSA